MRFLFTLFLLIGPAVTLLVACSGEAPGQRSATAERTPVVVEALALEPLRTSVEAVGTSRAIRSVELYPATSGEVVAVNFEPGLWVTAGTVLVELDDRDERLAVELAEVQLADARRLYERYVQTGNSGAVLPTTIDAARTQVDAARIALDKARVALDHRAIEAPFDGYVGISDIDAGDRVNPDTMITTLDDRSALLVSFELPEVLVRELGVGDSIRLGTWQDRSLSLSGEIVDVGSRIDPATRTFIARARVGNDADRLRPGMSFRVTANIEGERYPAIAETAVQWGADGAFIWTVVGGEAQRIPVDIVQRNEGRVLVDADLSRGDLVVVEGIQRMREGTPVEHPPVSLASDTARVQ